MFNYKKVIASFWNLTEKKTHSTKFVPSRNPFFSHVSIRGVGRVMRLTQPIKNIILMGSFILTQNYNIV